MNVGCGSRRLSTSDLSFLGIGRVHAAIGRFHPGTLLKGVWHAEKSRRSRKLDLAGL